MRRWPEFILFRISILKTRQRVSNELSTTADHFQDAEGLALPDDVRHQAIQCCVEMDPEAYQLLSQGARSYFAEWASASRYCGASMELFQQALERNGKHKAPPATQRSVGTGD